MPVNQKVGSQACSCYGANSSYDCCDCASVIKAYDARNWKYNETDFHQCRSQQPNQSGQPNYPSQSTRAGQQTGQFDQNTGQSNQTSQYSKYNQQSRFIQPSQQYSQNESQPLTQSMINESGKLPPPSQNLAPFIN